MFVRRSERNCGVEGTNDKWIIPKFCCFEVGVVNALERGL
jgi:hypothetical protein